VSGAGSVSGAARNGFASGTRGGSGARSTGMNGTGSGGAGITTGSNGDGSGASGGLTANSRWHLAHRATAGPLPKREAGTS